MVGPDTSGVLLVHGAHHGGWCWRLVMDELDRAGIASEAVDLPLTDYDDDVECVRAAVGAARARWGAVHVVCHSYGGLPVAAAGHGAAHLTFVAGRLPRPGESPAATTPAWRWPEFQACVEWGDDGAVRLSPAARDRLFHRTSPHLADLAMRRLRPMTSAVPREPVLDPAWRSVPSTYVVCTDDRAVRPDAQRERAALVGAAVEVDTDHSPFLSDAGLLTAIITRQHRAAVGT
jgi:hypothetical protein